MIRFVMVISIFFLGCKPSDNPIFKLPSNVTGEQNQQRLILQIRQESRPTDTDTRFTLSEADLPNDSMYISLNQSGFGSKSFQINVKVKEISGIYDTPITIEYDPSIIEFQFTSSDNSLIEGPIESRLRKFLPQNLTTLLSSPNSNNPGQIIISHSLLEDLGANQNYRGTLFSIPFRAIAPGNFKTSIGFIPSNSDILDRNGDSMNIQFYGGTITQNLDS